HASPPKKYSDFARGVPAFSKGLCHGSQKYPGRSLHIFPDWLKGKRPACTVRNKNDRTYPGGNHKANKYRGCERSLHSAIAVGAPGNKLLHRNWVTPGVNCQ